MGRRLGIDAIVDDVTRRYPPDGISRAVECIADHIDQTEPDLGLEVVCDVVYHLELSGVLERKGDPPFLRPGSHSVNRCAHPCGELVMLAERVARLEAAACQPQPEPRVDPRLRNLERPAQGMMHVMDEALSDRLVVLSRENDALQRQLDDERNRRLNAENGLRLLRENTVAAPVDAGSSPCVPGSLPDAER